MALNMPASLYELHRLDDEECVELMCRIRWPNGKMCPHCDGELCHRPRTVAERQHNPRIFTRIRGRNSWRCQRCKRQISLFGNTGLKHTQVPLRKWLHAIWMLGHRKSSITALQLAKEIDVHRTTATMMLRRLRHFMREEEPPPREDGVVPPTPLLCRGKVVVGRAPFDDNDVFAGPCSEHEQHQYPQEALLAVEKVERTVDGKVVTRCARLALAAAPLGVDFALFARRVIAPGARVSTSGADWPMHNLHALLRGTFHGVPRKFAPDYLGEYAFRFNHRRHEAAIPGIIARRLMHSRPLLRSALTTTAPSLPLTADQLPPPPAPPPPLSPSPAAPSADGEDLLLELLAQGRHQDAAALLQALRAAAPPPAAPGEPRQC